MQGCGPMRLDPSAVTGPKPQNPATVHGRTAAVVWLSGSATREGLAGAAARPCSVVKLRRCNPLLSPLLTSGSSHRNYSLRSSSSLCRVSRATLVGSTPNSTGRTSGERCA